jgi:hypothetical protein
VYEDERRHELSVSANAKIYRKDAKTQKARKDWRRRKWRRGKGEMARPAPQEETNGVHYDLTYEMIQ